MIHAPEFIISLDVGQAADYSAISGMRRISVATGETREEYKGTCQVQSRNYEDTFHLGLLERLPLHTPYPVMIERVAEITSKVPGTWRLVMDATGVGRPVYDMMRHLNPIGVIITGGQHVEQDRETGFWKVPKRVLVSNMQIHMQTKRLRIAGKLPLVDVFVKEALNFKMRINASGHMSFEAWREGVHDDLILSVATGLWWGNRTRTGWQTETGPMRDYDRLQRALAAKRYGFVDDDDEGVI